MKGLDQNLEKYISDQDITKRVKEISNEISRYIAIKINFNWSFKW